MTQERQRIEIAEYCGWKWYKARGSGIITFNTPPTTKRDDWVENQWDEITRPDNYLSIDVAFVNCPDYPNDLNAMHQAEKRLKPHRMSGSESTLWSDYFMALLRICEREKISSAHANAALRSETFVRITGKWRD